jgi:hypothetical protein
MLYTIKSKPILGHIARNAVIDNTFRLCDHICCGIRNLFALSRIVSYCKPHRYDRFPQIVYYP